jgi:hypothetical protein
MDILELDVVSYATAIGHAAALRLAQLLGPDFDPNFWFCDGGFAHQMDGEAMVSALGTYVIERTAMGGVVGAEQLFIKAGELGAHRHPADRFKDLDLWVRVAYAAFASVTALCARELGQAQEQARDEEEKRRTAVNFTAVSAPIVDLGSTDETIKLPATVAPVDGDVAGSPIPPDAESAPAVEGDDASSSTASVASSKKHKR